MAWAGVCTSVCLALVRGLIMKTYTVECYVKELGGWRFEGDVCGMGRNKGTWDSTAKSKRTAQRWAQELRKDSPERKYLVCESQ